MGQRLFQLVSSRRRIDGFTLVEAMAAIAVMALLLAMLLNATTLMGSTAQRASSTLEAFSTIRSAFDVVSQRLSQATLNTYWDYYDSSGNRRSLTATNFVPANYGRASDLQFLVVQNSQSAGYGQEVYFQTPEAYSVTANYRETEGMLNACGYYIRYGSDATFLPALMSQANPVTNFTPTLRWRYRLIQAMQDTQSLQVYQQASTDQQSWATSSTTGLDSLGEPLADNVIALIVWPRLPTVSDSTGTALTANYTYDSQASTGTTPQVITADQLPPVVQVTIVAIDEVSATRIDTHSATPPAVIESALLNKFTTSSVTQYQTDLYGDGTPSHPGLVPTLAAQHINCRVLNTAVALRESKWSQ